ncbi:hypothetical protein ACSLO6_30415, partial [Escherichia coli]
CLCERLNHILTAFYLSGMVKRVYPACDALSKRLFRFRQVIRKVNSGQWSSGDRVQVVAALMAIERELRSLRQVVREHGARDD